MACEINAEGDPSRQESRSARFEKREFPEMLGALARP
jgi:hypothetical protein